jgi:hypothetical protein
MNPEDITREREEPEREMIDRFILEEIESVPHLEALLLLFNSRPREWSLQQMADSLYISPHQTQPILQDLARRGFLTLHTGQYAYNQDDPRHNLIAGLDTMYRHELVRISTMIHARPSASVREFARAFRFKKD